MRKHPFFKYLTFSFIFSLTACESDCIFKHYDTIAGDTFCGRFCPLEDEEGNAVLDVDGNVIYDKPRKVEEANCSGVKSTSSSTSSTSSGSTT
ncbi:MAG: hypothetical protein KBC84_09205 [Proteobacteria bacterium]|nr:hypothetical protein [Pseudomonadota bacterium]